MRVEVHDEDGEERVKEDWDGNDVVHGALCEAQDQRKTSGLLAECMG